MKEWRNGGREQRIEPGVRRNGEESYQRTIGADILDLLNIASGSISNKTF